VLYFYNVEIERVVDGDTFVATIDLGFNLYHKTRIRLIDVDTPETWRPANAREREAGQHSTKYVSELIFGKKMYCQSQKLDVYGRSLGVLFYEENGVMVNVNELIKQFLIDNNYCKSELRNEK
jgi:endonuclease YncB( thermonuclease family)